MRPDVTVCITTYEHEGYIEKCLRSVLDQRFEGSLEILVGDDGSSDATPQIIDAIAKENPEKIRVIHSQVRLGPNRNIQNLVSNAKGRYIAHLDGDDYWLPDKLSRQIPIISSDPSVSAVYTNAQVVSETGARLGVFCSCRGQDVSLSALLERGNFLNYSSMVYRENLRHIVLDATPPFVDYTLNLRLARLGRIAFVDEPLVGYRWRSRGSMIRTMPGDVLEGQVRAFCEAVTWGARRDLAWRGLGRLWGKFALSSILAGQSAETFAWGRRILSDAVIAYPRAMMIRDTLLAIPRAALSVARRRLGRKVYFA